MDAAYRLIDDTDLVLTIPAASLEQTPASAVVTVYGETGPLEGAEVLALFPNKTWKSAKTTGDGEAVLDLYATHLPMSVFAAAPGRVAGHIGRWVPAEGAMAFKLEALTLTAAVTLAERTSRYTVTDGGSAIFAESTGHVPGLNGRLNRQFSTPWEGRTSMRATSLSTRACNSL